MVGVHAKCFPCKVNARYSLRTKSTCLSQAPRNADSQEADWAYGIFVDDKDLCRSLVRRTGSIEGFVWWSLLPESL